MEQQNVLNFDGLQDPVELFDGTVAEKRDCVFCVDDNAWHYADDCVEVNGEWYLEDSDLIHSCEECGRLMLADEHCPDCECQDYLGRWQFNNDCREVNLRGYGYSWINERDLENNWYYCRHCDEYVEDNEWDYDNDCCYDCSDSLADGKIWDYHDHPRDEIPFYGADKDGFVGGGFELEISGNPNSTSARCPYNQEFAEDLATSCGLEDGEIYFESDCSIGSGFEIISAPHTVKDFWDKQKAWADMLDACSRAGFKSHDAGCCGLHVHVSRGMFGPKEKQNFNIAKVARLYTLRWDDFVKASRRKRLNYCRKVEFHKDYGSAVLVQGTDGARMFKSGLRYDAMGHGVALNNSNSATFEYRLGRGTLNKVSFFAWIDLCFTLTKNSKKSERLLFSKQSEWLDGIREQTAKYLYNKGAFVSEVLELFPQLEWESSVVDQEIA